MPTHTLLRAPAHANGPFEPHPRVGQWRYHPASERWWWSEQTYRLHGFEPGEIAPSTRLILAHKDRADGDHFAQLLERAVAAGQGFHCGHAITSVHGHRRELAVVGRPVRDRRTGELLEIAGYIVDVTMRTS